MGEIKHQVTLLELLNGIRRTSRNPRSVIRGLAHLISIKPGRKKSIGRLLATQARRYPDHIALADMDTRYTYCELDRRANQLAALLRHYGVRPGQSVAMLMENRAEMLVAAAGVVKLGAVATMLNYNQRGEVLAHSLSITEPRAIIVGSECRQAFESVRERLPAGLDAAAFWLADSGDRDPIAGLIDLAAELDPMPASEPAETQEITTSDPAFYVFTSGTTGMPKAAVMSHGRWLRGMAGVGLVSLRMDPKQVFYCPLPLYHNNALTLSWGAALGAGATLAISRKFSVSRFWDEVDRFGATGFCYIGELCRYLLSREPDEKERNHKVRVVLGNGLRPELWTEFRRRFGIRHINEFYGASECNLLFTNGYDQEQSCGFTPYSYAIVRYDPDTEAPLRDEHGKLTKVGRGEVGLLLARVTKRAPYDGYTSTEESENKLLRDAFKRGDCWFDTGDLVRNMGLRHIQFVDRLGDTFRWKGENVATTEVEMVLNELDSIYESVVYGVEVPGAEGRAGMAALTLNDGAELDGKALAAHLWQRLPPYAVPLFLRTRASQETTSTFKYQKSALKRQGFDPNAIDEPCYVLLDRERGYEPLTPERFDELRNGRVAL